MSTTKLHWTLTEEQMKRLESGTLKIEVDESGKFAVREGRRVGIGRTPRMALEALR